MYDARDYQTLIAWSDVDQTYVAECVEMPGVMRSGDTREEAARAIHEAIVVSLEVAARKNFPMPPPARLAAAA